MIIDIHEKYDVSPEWFEEQLKDALKIASPDVVEQLFLPRICELLTVYRIHNEAGAKESAMRMKVMIDSPLIDESME